MLDMLENFQWSLFFFSTAVLVREKFPGEDRIFPVIAGIFSNQLHFLDYLSHKSQPGVQRSQIKWRERESQLECCDFTFFCWALKLVVIVPNLGEEKRDTNCHKRQNILILSLRFTSPYNTVQHSTAQPRLRRELLVTTPTLNCEVFNKCQIKIFVEGEGTEGQYNFQFSSDL